MIASFFITLLGGIVGLLYAQNQDLKEQVERLQQVENELFLKEYEDAALSYKINDAIQEADENERWG